MRSTGSGKASSDEGASNEEIGVLVSHYRHGRLREALKHGAELVQRHPNSALIRNIVGAANAGLGRLDEAVASYMQALRINPDSAEAHNNLGIALWALGRRTEGIASYMQAIRIKPEFASAHYNLARGFAALGQQQDAIASYTTALKIKPDFAEAHNNLGITLHAMGKYEAAIASYRQALRNKPVLAEAHNNLGITLNEIGQHEQAIASYTEAIRIKPDYAEAHYNLGIVLETRGKYEDAAASYAEALRIKPDNAEAHNNLGRALAALGLFEQAIGSFRNALKIKPAFAEAHGNLCDIYEKTNRLADLKETLLNAQSHCPNNEPQILFRLAQLASREERYEDARTYLEAFSGERQPIAIKCGHSELLSKTYDKLNNFDAAFAQFEITNALLRQSPAAKECDPDRYLDEVSQLTASWSRAPEFPWPRMESSDVPASLAFLVGFPRSGTTLMDTVLRSHPRISVVEEMPMLPAVRRRLRDAPTFEILNGLSSAEIAGLRDVYLEELLTHISDSPAGNLVVDKLPLNITNIGLIHRIFPKAPFILVLRHPCDCVLSCFMQKFRLNDAMANFLDLHQSAKLYDAVMTLWTQYRQKLNLEVGTIRYEDLVVDLRSSTEPLLDILGLEWDDNLNNFKETALSRGRINTPSYHQVTQELYTQASGRWHHYERHMLPVLPMLEPWAEHWGYHV